MYAKLDELILARIRAGFKTFALIHAADVFGEAMRISREQNIGRSKRESVDAWRIVDRRLQALRRRGEIAYDSKAGWNIKEN